MLKIVNGCFLLIEDEYEMLSPEMLSSNILDAIKQGRMEYIKDLIQRGIIYYLFND